MSEEPIEQAEGNERRWRLSERTADSLRVSLRERASRLGRQARIVLALTVACLLAGAVGFYWAGNLVLKESFVSVTALEKKLEDVRSDVSRLNQAASELAKVGLKFEEVEAVKAQIKDIQLSREYLSQRLGEITKDLEELAAYSWEGEWMPAEDLTILTRVEGGFRGWDTVFPEVVAGYMIDGFPRISREGKSRIVGSAREGLERLRAQIARMDEEISQLQQEIEVPKAEQFQELSEQAGAQLEVLRQTTESLDAYTQTLAAKQAEQSDSTRLLAALGTRLVVLVILVFLVQILVNLYRYYLRLGSYYHDRADLMSMAPEMDAITLQLVASTLSAEVDFKPPASPSEQAVEILKSVSSIRKN